MRGPRASPTKSKELLDVAIWDIRIKHFISAARVYVHVTAVATIGLVCAMFAQPTSMPPLQVSMALLGWIQHHVVATETLTMNKARMRLLVLLHYVQCGAFVYGLPSDCEPQLLLGLQSFFIAGHGMMHSVGKRPDRCSHCSPLVISGQNIFLPVEEHAILTSALVLTIRFTISLLSADIGTAVPAQALFMMHEIWIAWKRDPSTVSW